MELKKGMYVRTDDGYIAKCIYIDNELENIYGFDSAVRRSFGDTYDFIYCKEQEKYITKASNNIIDLIEVGDYVNGELVVRIEKDPFIKGQINLWTNTTTTNYWGDIGLSPIIDKNIKSIVTKEQFESMQYKVEE